MVCARCGGEGARGVVGGREVLKLLLHTSDERWIFLCRAALRDWRMLSFRLVNFALFCQLGALDRRFNLVPCNSDLSSNDSYLSCSGKHVMGTEWSVRKLFFGREIEGS